MIISNGTDEHLFLVFDQEFKHPITGEITQRMSIENKNSYAARILHSHEMGDFPHLIVKGQDTRIQGDK